MESGFLRQYLNDRPFYDKKGAIENLLYPRSARELRDFKNFDFGGFSVLYFAVYISF